MGFLGDRTEVDIWFPLGVPPGLGVSGAQADPVWNSQWVGRLGDEKAVCQCGWRCGLMYWTPHSNPILHMEAQIM